MAVKAEWVTTKTPDGDMRVYVASPEGSGPYPAIIVIMEIFGVNEHIQEVTRRYAEEALWPLRRRFTTGRRRRKPRTRTCRSRSACASSSPTPRC